MFGRSSPEFEDRTIHTTIIQKTPLYSVETLIRIAILSRTLVREPVSGDFWNNSWADFFSYLQEHYCFVFVAEDLHFAFEVAIADLLIETAVYKNLVGARRWMDFLYKQIVLSERYSENNRIHRDQVDPERLNKLLT